MSERKFTPLVPVLAGLLLAACTSPVGPQESGIETPSLWSRLTGSAPAKADPAAPLVQGSDAEVEQNWWRRFGDPTLDTLVAEALAGNQTLAMAKARVEEAEAARGLARSRLLPDISAAGSAQRANQGYTTGDKAVSVAEIDLKATWELDLFGRNQARMAEASALLQSEEATRQGVRVALLAEVARTYFDLRDSLRQIELTRQNLGTQRRTLEIIRAQRQGALASDFDVQRAGARVSATEALIPTLETTRDVALNRLAVLLGRPPGGRDTLLATLSPIQPLDSGIVIAAPAKVLAARPDVRAAERRFAASLSAKDAATAELFPNISLAALFGAQTATPLNATPWGIGLSLVQPILNFGRIESQIDAADARQRQAFLAYQRSVLEALEDMENALSRYGHEAGRNIALTTGVAQNRRASELAHTQYTNGYTGLLDVLVAERDLLDAEAAQASSDTGLRRNLVAIYAAAGGGWNDRADGR
ncbi:efflux transporter outer membrane subunit [Magnetospirillum sp. 15-1]|uniref:efflux transporter outer membrane subunit n=1 Tax=Magnetospirillum sp. 15-1 TaxID=1979370 RepID=UPI000BBCF63A|nr:efflux transporter outer membrane subunit [Magnetospirillum sp. 15-1]